MKNGRTTGAACYAQLENEDRPHRGAFEPPYATLSSPNHPNRPIARAAGSRILRAGPKRPGADPAIGNGTKRFDAGILSLRRLVTLL